MDFSDQHPIDSPSGQNLKQTLTLTLTLTKPLSLKGSLISHQTVVSPCVSSKPPLIMGVIQTEDCHSMSIQPPHIITMSVTVDYTLFITPMMRVCLLDTQ